MSNTDDNNGIPDRPRFMGRGGMPNDHQSYGQEPQRDDQQLGSLLDQQTNNQTDYSQFGGQQDPNQPYSGVDQYNQGNYPAGGQLGYDQPAYDQQGNPLSSNTYDQGFGQQLPQDGSYTDYSLPAGGQSPNYADSGQNYTAQNYTGQDYASQSYSDQQYATPSTDYASNYQQQSYDQQTGYAYPAGQNDGFQGFNDQGETEDAPFQQNEYPDEAMAQDEKPRKKSRTPVMLGALLAVVIAGGGVGYAFTNGMLSLGESNQASTSNPIFIRKDNSLVKHRPTEEGGQDVRHTNKKIFDRLDQKPDGGSNQVEARLQNRAEKVIEPSSKSTSNDDGGVPGFSISGTTPVRPVNRNPVNRNPGNNTGSVRKVKVIPVRPDGRFGSSGNLSGVSISSTSSNSSSNQRPRDPGIAGLAFTPSKQNEQESVPVRSSIGQPQRPIRKTSERVVPSEPENKPVTNQRVASLTEPTQPQQRTRSFANQAPSNTQASSGGRAFVVQLAARREHTDALEAFVDMQQKYPTILSPFVPFIQRADLTSKGKGIWYRLRVGPMNSRQAALNVCDQLKSQGFKSCFVRPK